MKRLLTGCVFALSTLTANAQALLGDSNRDGQINVGDVVRMILEEVTPEVPVLADTLCFDQPRLCLPEGASASLSVSFLPDNVTYRNVVWASLNRDIARVEDGCVQALANGRTQIMALALDGSGAYTLCDLIVTGSETFSNPVNRQGGKAYDWPDPTVWRGDDGRFYTYSTAGVTYPPFDAADRRGQLLASDNLMDWALANETHRVLTTEDYQTMADLGQNFWSPQVVRLNGQWLMYITLYNSASDSRIAVLRYNAPTFPSEGGTLDTWQYVGVLTDSKVTGIIDTIDPYVVADPETGRNWLFFGSTGMCHRVELSADGLSLLDASNPTYTHVAGLPVAQNSGRDKVFEGSCLYYHAPYWYYFVSAGNYGDHTYCLKVGRSESLTGSFVDQEGNAMTEGNATTILSTDNGKGAFWGPGHCGEIITDDAGRDYIVYHCHSTAASKPEQRPLMLQRIFWNAEGWPYFTGGTPQESEVQPVFLP